MHYNDARDGTNTVCGDLLPKYQASLDKHGMIGKDGLHANFYAVKQQMTIAGRAGAHTAWYVYCRVPDIPLSHADSIHRGNAFMNTWNSEVVYSSFDKHTLGFLVPVDGKTKLQPTSVGMAFRKLVLEEACDAQSHATLTSARERSRDYVARIPFELSNWQAFTMLLSELGKTEELRDLLEHVDTYCQPTWQNGGLYYPRNETMFDKDWNYIHMEPHSGNSAFGYARLNVQDGQKQMWERPRRKGYWKAEPWVDSSSFEDGVDFLRAQWDSDRQAMILTVQRWQESTASLASVTVRNLPPGLWAVFLDGILQQQQTIDEARGSVTIQVSVSTDEVDLVITKS